MVSDWFADYHGTNLGNYNHWKNTRVTLQNYNELALISLRAIPRTAIKGFMFLTSLPLIDVFIADILWRKSSDLNFIPFFVRNRFAK